MDKSLVFSKTAKGMTEFKAGGKNLAREHARILSLINGKSSIADMIEHGALIEGKYAATIESLVEHGLIRVFEGSRYHTDSFEWTTGFDDDDFSDLPQAITVEELSPQESVQIWAQAKRGASELKSARLLLLRQQGAADAGGRRHRPARAGGRRRRRAGRIAGRAAVGKGMLVQVAADVPSALAAVHNGAPPDIVLLDIVLPGQPGKDGFDVLTFIRRQLAWSRVPVVMVTSEVSDDQVMKGLKARRRRLHVQAVQVGIAVRPDSADAGNLTQARRRARHPCARSVRSCSRPGR
ncbi:response regulator [Massilia sp. B-10]|nr:response regulator [Massilia sp. B-10]